jgi:hypothetical protein
LLPYTVEPVVHADSTQIDRDIQARARAMVPQPNFAGAQPTVVTAPALPPARLEEPSIEDAFLDQPVVPGLGAAMLLRVRFAGGEVPLWGLIAPVIAVAALTAALAAAAVSGVPQPGEVSDAAKEAASAQAAGATSAPPASAEPAAVASATSRAAAPTASASNAPAAANEVEGFDIAPGKYTAGELLSSARKRVARDEQATTELKAALERDPGLLEEPRTLGELRRLSDNPVTAPAVLEMMSALPAPVAADMLYEVWTGTVQRNATTELARALLYSKDVRPKASPALAVALDLRVASNCRENQAILGRAEKDGDRRALHLVLQLQRRYGCGANKRQDCNACLRGSDDVDKAVKAVRDRREPHPFGRR